MKLAFVDADGTTFSAVHRCCLEGHEVLYLITGGEPATDPEDAEDIARTKTVGDGLVPKAKDWREIVAFKAAAVVVYQETELHEQAVKAGIPTWGADARSAVLETDRLAAAQLARRYGVGVVPTTLRFVDAETALTKIRQLGGERWVVKAEGANVETASTHVCDSLDHLAETLKYEAERGATSFIVQEHVAGVEISTEGWFDYRTRQGWLTPIIATLERKRMFAGDVGPMSGAMGSVCWAWPGPRPRLFRETLLPLTPYLRGLQYVGPLDVNCIIDEATQTPHFLEFTPRLGWDAFDAEMAGFQGSVGEFFVRLAQGKATQVPLTNEFMVSIGAYIRTAEDMPLLIPEAEGLGLKYVKYERGDAPSTTSSFLGPTPTPAARPRSDAARRDGRLVSAGCETANGFTLICEAYHTGPTIRAATDPIYERLLPQVQAPDLTYRSDIGIQAQVDLDRLESWDYETPGSELQPWNAGMSAMSGRRRGVSA